MTGLDAVGAGVAETAAAAPSSPMCADGLATVEPGCHGLEPSLASSARPVHSRDRLGEPGHERGGTRGCRELSASHGITPPRDLGPDQADVARLSAYPLQSVRLPGLAGQWRDSGRKREGSSRSCRIHSSMIGP